MKIHADDLDGDHVARLLGEHLRDMHAITPPESVHALPHDALRQKNVTFWTVREGAALLGCGALKELDARSGEIKSMRTAYAHRRRGVAAFLLAHIVSEARGRGYRRLFLETGSLPEFEPARALYVRHGFSRCGPFGEYTADPNSVYFSVTLSCAD